MADEKTVVYRFPNATLVKFAGTSYYGAVLTDGTDKVLKTEDSPISSEIAGKLYGVSFYGPAIGELKIEQVRTVEAVDRYVARDWKSGLRDLSAEDYEKLSDNFKSLYKKELAEPQEVRTEIVHVSREVPVELTESIIMGQEFISDLHRQVNVVRESERRKNSYYGTRDPRPELWRFLPLVLSGVELMEIMGNIGQAVGRGRGYQAWLTFHKGYASEPNVFDISYYARPYNGEMRKVLEKKKNGQPYADRRGRMVRDMAPVVGKALVTESDIVSWWESVGGAALSDGEKFEAIQKLTRHLWRVQNAS